MPRPIRDLLNDLNTIYSEVPAFECKPDCSACCGPVQWSLIEEVNIQRYLNQKHMKMRIKKLVSLDDPICPYVNAEHKCDIYPVRPLLCRVFGVLNNFRLVCPFMPAKQTLPDEKWKEWQSRIHKLDEQVPKSVKDRAMRRREKNEPS